MKTQNYLLSDTVDIEGTGTQWDLIIGIEIVTDQAREFLTVPPTWQKLCDLAIAFCEENNICLSYLAEQGSIRRGPGSPRFPFSDAAKVYIAKHVMK